MSATADRAQLETGMKPDSLRSTRAGAIWTALPARDQHLLLWLLGGDIVTAQLAALLVYGQLRSAQRRLSRLVELGNGVSGWSRARRHGQITLAILLVVQSYSPRPTERQNTKAPLANTWTWAESSGIASSIVGSTCPDGRIQRCR